MFKIKSSLRNVAATVACLAAAAIFTGCDKGNDDPITVADNTSLTQNVFADEQQGKSGVSFTTAGAWTSSISTTSGASAQSAPMKAAAANESSWISISPDHGDKAGTYTIAITLTPNTTGADRTAVITISCNGTDITITVTQKGTTEGGEVPVTPLKLVSRIDFYGGDIGSNDVQSDEFRYDAQNRLTEVLYTSVFDENSTTTITYPDASTIVMSGENFDGGSVTFTLNSEGAVVAMTDGTGETGQTNTYANGYLQKAESLVGAGTVGNHTGNNTDLFTWANGNLTAVHSELKYLDRPSLNATQDITFEYGAVENKSCSIDLGFLGLEIVGTAFRGWFGKSNAYMPSKVTVIDSKVQEPQIITYRYETDSEGYVTKIYEREDSGEERLRHIITYK